MPIITREVEKGFEASGRLKTVTSLRTWLFSGGWPMADDWPAKNVHTDLEFARSCGLPSRGASGAMLMGYLTELLVDLFGEQWLTKGTLSLKFVRIVEIGDEIVARASVVSRREDGPRVGFDMELWCENQRGEKVAVGSGTGWIR